MHCESNLKFNTEIKKNKLKTKNMASPGLEPETFSVLDWRDNQLHHDTTRFNFSLNNLSDKAMNNLFQTL